jgi:nucleolar GTP-binding protein
MQAITALAHLNACVLFLLDISETCGYTIEQQVSLFNNIKPLFQAKPLVIVLTKIDLMPFSELDSAMKMHIEKLAKETNAYLIQMSNQSGDGIADVRARACDILLDHRLTQKAKDPKKAEAIMNKLHIAQPKKRDNKVRDITIPDTFLRGVKKSGPTIKELQDEYGGAGNFYIPEEEHFILEKEDWRYDKWPEFYLGKNVADFYDAEIVAKLDALEKEEDAILQLEADKAEEIGESSDEDGINAKDLAAAVKKVRGKITVIKMRHQMKSKTRAVSKIKDLGEMTEALEKKGIAVNKESLATRVKNPRRIGDLEETLEK